MKLLSYNSRGLGNPEVVASVRALVQRQSPEVHFLLEIKLYSTKMERIRVGCKMTGCFVVNPRGRVGGLALLWKEGVDVSISSYTTNHIDAHVGGEVQAFTAGENILLRSSHGDWWITWALSAFPLGSLLATSILSFTYPKKGGPRV